MGTALMTSGGVGLVPKDVGFMPVLLWENSNTGTSSAAFGAQKITVDTTPYNFFLVDYKNSSTNGGVFRGTTIIGRPSGAISTLVNGGGTCFRTISISDNEISIERCLWFNTYNGGGVEDNNSAYPLAIYGLKKDTTYISSLKTLDIYSSALPGAAVHNGLYRGKYLGDSVTLEQYQTIQEGEFSDLFIGDYWTIGGVNYRIAAFDYYLNSGDTSCTTHHAVIVPDTCLYNAQMHNTSSGQYESGAANTTAGGYVGSDMYTKNLETAKTTIKNAFSGHVLKHRIYLTNAVANGRASAGAWCDSEVDLMCEQMVYGSGIFSPVSDGSNVPANYRVEKSQLPLFQHEPSRISNRNNWWLRDVITASRFAIVDGYGGGAYCDTASYSFGVRPAFCIS